MKKSQIIKFLSSVSTILVMLNTSGCKLKYDLNNVFSDKSISTFDESHDLDKVSKVYKDTFFLSTPIIYKYDFDNSYLKDLFSNFYVDLDFNACYLFLNEYANYVKSLNNGDINKQNIYNFAQFFKNDEYSNNANFSFVKDNNIYEMEMYERDYILDHFESVSQKCKKKNLTFHKNYRYVYNKIPGDKNISKNTANWIGEYELSFYKDEDLYQIVINNNSIINEVKNNINTLSSKKEIMVLCNGVVCYADQIDEQDFSDYVLSLYTLFTRDYNFENVKEDTDNIILKLIK